MNKVFVKLKKVISFILCIALIWGLVPNVAFAADTYTLTIKTNQPTCKVTYNNTDYENNETIEIAAGTDVRLYAKAGSGYQFSNATSEDVTVAHNGSIGRKFTMPEKNVTVTFNFEEKPEYEATIDNVDFGTHDVGYDSDTIGAILFNIKNTGTNYIDYLKLEMSGENLDENFSYGQNNTAGVAQGSTNNSRFWIKVKDDLPAGTYTATATLKISPTSNEEDYFVADTATITFKVAAKYTLTIKTNQPTCWVKNGPDSTKHYNNATIQITSGESVLLYGQADTGFIFSDATSEDVTLDKNGSIGRRFTMPEKDVTVTFNFDAIDNRTVVSNVIGTVEDFIPEYGDTYKEVYTFVFTEGQQAYVTDSMAKWLKKSGDDWNEYNGATFIEGTYKYKNQLRIDDTNGTTHKLTEDVNVNINGEKWNVTSCSIFDQYSYAWIESPEVTIERAEMELTFNHIDSYDIKDNYVDIAITEYSVANGVIGGTEPYTFSKTSGPNWITVSNTGTISGTPTTIGSNDDLVVRVTDSVDAYKEITIEVRNTLMNPNDRTVVSNVVGTVEDFIPEYGDTYKEVYTFVFTEGQQAYVTDSMAKWLKKSGDDWNEYNEASFIEGTYKYKNQLRIDDTNGTTHKLAEDVNVNINGEKWNVTSCSIYDKYSYAWIESPEIVIINPIATTYTVTVTNGTASPTSAEEGATVIITANEPATGKEFDRWTVNAGGVTLADATASTTTFTMGGSNVSVTANYKDVKYWIAAFTTTRDTTQGGVKIGDAANYISSTGSNYNVNTNLALMAKAADGYKFLRWDIKDDPSAPVIDNSTDNPLNITVTKTGYYYAVFEELPRYTITVTDGTANPVEAYEGTIVTITANEPATGKEFDRWTVNAGGVTLADATASETTFTMGETNVEVTATYKNYEIKDSEVTLESMSETYTGSPIEVGVTVTIKGNTLQKGTDYTVSYEENTNVGTQAKVTVTGAGNYTGTVNKYFEITKAKLTKPTLNGTYVFNDVAQTAELNNFDDTKMNVSGNERTDAGSQDITVSLKNTDNYCWDDDTVNDVIIPFTISPKAITPVVSAIDAQIYTGSEIKPTLEVKFGDPEVTLNAENYEVTYLNNTNVGTATAKITAKADGNYTWDDTEAYASKEFTINPMTITPVIADITAVTFTNEDKTPELVVTGDSKTLVNGIDYEVAYVNNKYVGTATAKITSKATGSNYKWTGEVTKDFTINPATSTLSGNPTNVTDSVNTKAFVQLGKIKDISTYITLEPSAYQNEVTFTLFDAGTTGATLDTDGKTLKGATTEGTVTLKASFAGKDLNGDSNLEYSPATDLTFYVKAVNKEEVTIDGLIYTSKEYDGTVVTPTGTLAVTDDKVDVNELDKVFEKYNTSTSTWEAFDEALATNVGKYRVTYSVKSDNENYMGTTTYEFDITVKKLTKPTLSGTYEYTGSELTATLNNFVDGKMTVENNKRTVVGSQDITIKLADTTNYNWEDDSIANLIIPFEITKATPTVTLSNLSQKVGSVTAVTYTFAPAVTDGTVKVEYKVSTEDDATYTETLPTEKGTYSVRVSLVGDANLNDTQKVDTLTIAKKSSGGGSSSSVTKYEIKVTAGIGGKISPETTKVEKGDSKKFTITADEGYEIEDVLVDGKSVGAVSNYKFENVKEKHTIKATFKKVEEEEIKDTEEDTSWENPFEDIIENEWYYNAVEFVNENGLFSGMSKNEFGPTVAMTRGMFVTVLSKLHGGEIDGEADFIDVDPNAYYAKPIAWAYTKGIVNGVGNNMFAPNMSITREQLAVMMYNYMVVEQIDKPASLVEFPEFADAEEISDWATNAVNVMRATGLMSGKPNNKFDPKGTATRAEVATILMNFCK